MQKYDLCVLFFSETTFDVQCNFSFFSILQIFTDSDSSPSPKRPRRSDIDSVLANNTDLVADGSRMYCLPTIPGKHKDLKNITPQTVSYFRVSVNNRFNVKYRAFRKKCIKNQVMDL